MDSGVYKITCLGNNKFYIGSSQNITKRFNVHKRQLNNNTHINPFLKNAWNKYGESNFVFEVIEYCDIDILLEREQYYMDKTQCYNREIGFNNCLKSDRPLGYKHTEENKLIMSKNKKGTKQKIETTKKIIESRKNYKHTEETKNKIRLTKIGNKNPRYGFKEDTEIAKDRMKNMLSKPRWNTGLTSKDDQRINKLAYWKDKITPNAIKHTLVDLELNIEWTELSLMKLSKVCPVSISTLSRLKNKTAGKLITSKYKLIW